MNGANSPVCGKKDCDFYKSARCTIRGGPTIDPKLGRCLSHTVKPKKGGRGAK
jgi:hypothetical protein